MWAGRAYVGAPDAKGLVRDRRRGNTRPAVRIVAVGRDDDGTGVKSGVRRNGQRIEGVGARKLNLTDDQPVPDCDSTLESAYRRIKIKLRWRIDAEGVERHVGDAAKRYTAAKWLRKVFT